jgi:hypothetical protein
MKEDLKCWWMRSGGLCVTFTLEQVMLRVDSCKEASDKLRLPEAIDIICMHLPPYRVMLGYARARG